LGKCLLIETQFLPSVLVFAQFLKQQEIWIEAQENFQKQTLRNRCHILTANGTMPLIVPIEKTESKKIRDVKIDYNQRWQQIHIGAIQSAYGKSPFFEFYFEDFRKIILTNCTYLYDLNEEILSKCLDFLKVKINLNHTSIYEKLPKIDCNDFRNHFSTKEVKFSDSKFNIYPSYYQVFGNNFVQNLSIIDLLFNEGTNAKEILYKYIY
jgi:hypothetical protein